MACPAPTKTAWCQLMAKRPFGSIVFSLLLLGVGGTLVALGTEAMIQLWTAEIAEYHACRDGPATARHGLR